MKITKEKIRELIMEEINQELAALEEQQEMQHINQIYSLIGKMNNLIGILNSATEKHNKAILKLAEDVKDIKRGR